MAVPDESITNARLFTHATIVTVNKFREVILDGALLVEAGRITAIGKTKDLVERINVTELHVDVVDCANKIIIPGLVNTHAHLAQSLLRGLAEDLPLHSWLCDAIWPLEANYADEDGYVAAMLTIAEMLKTGTTCFLEAMLTHRSGLENVVKAIKQTGIRACLVRPLHFSRNEQVLKGACIGKIDQSGGDKSRFEA